MNEGYRGRIVSETIVTTNTTTTTRTINYLTFDNDKHDVVEVVSGEVGEIVPKVDDTWWVTSCIPESSTNTLQDATYGNGVYVVVGEYGTILTSTDCGTWDTRDSGTASHLWGHCVW